MDDSTRLALAAGAGDERAVVAFIRGLQAEVWRLCAHLVDRQSADDLTQDTFLRAVRALPSFRGESSARTWLLVIARRVCADEIRRRTRSRRLYRQAEAQLQTNDGYEAERSGELALHELIGSLDVDRASAFVLTQILGLSYAEAAEVCECPVGTIRSRVARARSDLVDQLGDVAVNY